MRNVIVVLILANIFIWSTLLRTSNAELDFLDVGQGDSILIQDGETQVLIDSGPDGDVVYELSKVMPRGDKKIEAIVMTHADLDHYGGFAEILRRYEVEYFVSTGQETNSEQFRELLSELETEKAHRIRVAGGQSIKINDLEFKVLFPFSLSEDDNANSIVLQTKIQNQKIFLSGDVERASERTLTNYYKNDLDADIMKVGHHGSNTSTSEGLLKYVTPKYSIIQVGRNNYGHPTHQVLERLRISEILRNDTNGTIRFIFKNGSLEIKKEKI